MLTIQFLGKRILVVVAHADDVATVFNGTLKRLIDEGAEVTVVVISDSRGNNGSNLSELRRQEELLSAKRTGIWDVRFLKGYPDGHRVTWDKVRLVQELTQLIRERKPTAVFSFDPANGLTGHRNHREGADCVEQAIITSGCHCLMVCAAITHQWLTEVMPHLRDLARAIYTDVSLIAVPESQLDLVIRLSDQELADKVLAALAHESQMLPLIRKLTDVGGLGFLAERWFRFEAYTIRRPWHPHR